MLDNVKWSQQFSFFWPKTCSSITCILPSRILNTSPFCFISFSTDLSAASIRDFLLPTIQNLLKDLDALDPAHKEALEIIVKERSGGTLDAISKVMGAHLGLASSMTSFFGEGGLLGKKEMTVEVPNPAPPAENLSPKPMPSTPVEDTRFMRIMRGNFTDMLRAKARGPEDQTQ